MTKNSSPSADIYFYYTFISLFAVVATVAMAGAFAVTAKAESYAVSGVVTDVQHRVSKQGKGWALFTIEDYTDSYEFRIFGEEYLKFRHFITINQFIRIKISVKEGWRNQETGRVGEPRIQFVAFEMLHDTLSKNSKKLTLQLLKKSTIIGMKYYYKKIQLG